MNMDSQWSNQEACFARETQVWLAVNHNTSITSGNEFDVQTVLHRQVSLAAVNQICVIHEAMTVAKIYRFIKGLLRKCKYIVLVYVCILSNFNVGNNFLTIGPRVLIFEP